MKKRKFLWALIVAFVSTTFLLMTSCVFGDDDDDEEVKGSIDEALKNGLIRLTNGVGEWNQGIIFADGGYAVVKQGNANEDFYMQLRNDDDDFDCAIVASNDNCLPKEVITPNFRVYFDNIGDSVLEISKSNQQGIETVGRVSFSFGNRNSSRGTTFTTIEYLNRDDKVHKVCKALDAVLKAGSNYTELQLQDLKTCLDKISPFYYYENVESILEELDLCRTENEETNEIIYCFTQYASRAKVRTYDPIRYGITVKTGISPISVGSTSAILSGRVYCSSDHIFDKGEWGIILSKNSSHLDLDNYEKIYIASEKDFELTAYGLEPNTTYYYKTFFRFKNPGDHGDLVMSYGPKDADSYVDADFFMKDFTTNEQRGFEIIPESFKSEYVQEWDGNHSYYISFKISVPGLKTYNSLKFVFDRSVPTIDYGNLQDEWNYHNGYYYEGNDIEVGPSETIEIGEKFFINMNMGSGTFRFKIVVDVVDPSAPTTGNQIETDWLTVSYGYNFGMKVL